MKKYSINIIIVLLFVYSCGGSGGGGSSGQTSDECSDGPETQYTGTYVNPVIDKVGPADPSVIFYNGLYYLYPTGDAVSYDVYISNNLVDWEKGPKVFDPGGNHVWAPDVFYDPYDQQFYLYYSVNERIGVAVADEPDEIFMDQGILIGNGIDAHMFLDDDGNYYLYYSSSQRIYVQQMESPLIKQGNPRQLLIASEPWERHGAPVTEAPFMLQHNGLYYLLYSGSAADNVNYAIGYATSWSPAGPFTKHPGNPIVAKDYCLYGPGHCSVIEDDSGELWMIYHQKESGNERWNRFICIDPMWFDSNGTLYVNPTRGTVETAPLF